MAGFPRVGISGDVRAQERLLRELFGNERLELVVGGSVVAQQTYEWAVRFPEKDLFFPPRDCAAEQKLVPGSELRPTESTGGHLSLFSFEESYMPQINQHLRDLLSSPV